MASIESSINGYAHDFVCRTGTLDQLTKDYLTESRTRFRKGIPETEASAFVSLEEKLLGWTRIMSGNEFPHSDTLWKNFKTVLEFRNTLIHFKVGKSSDVYGNGDITMGRLAIESAQAIIERFYQTIGEAVPAWVRASYQEIR